MSMGKILFCVCHTSVHGCCSMEFSEAANPRCMRNTNRMFLSSFKLEHVQTKQGFVNVLLFANFALGARAGLFWRPSRYSYLRGGKCEF